MRIAFFEDDRAADLYPISLLRPVFELVCGQFSLRERLIRRFEVSEWGVFVRDWLAETYREAHPEAYVNETDWLKQGTTLLVNGRWLPSLEALADIGPHDTGLLDDEIVYLTLDSEQAAILGEPIGSEMLSELARSRRNVKTSGRLIRFPWDLIDENSRQLTADYRLRQYGRPQAEPGSQVSVLGSVENVYIHPRACIDPFVVLDARNGPISIDAGAVIQPFTRIEGPCHVASAAQLFRANVRAGTTIGPVCRVGGEVETSILHGHVNKYHDGFLGHAYVCPWVNLGALTTNSDLKNDYSTVNVPLRGESIPSESTKVGSFIGDHTKTALGSLFNTGSSIGVMCMILPGGELLPKHVPSFSRIWHGDLDEEFDLEAGLQTARTAMNRRERELTPAQERLLKFVFAVTAEERAHAILRFEGKRHQRELSALPQPVAG